MNRFQSRVVLSLLTVLLAAPCAHAQDQNENSGNEQLSCMKRIKSIDQMLDQGIWWIQDKITFDRIANELSSYLICNGYAAKLKDPCENLMEKIGPAASHEGKPPLPLRDWEFRCHNISGTSEFLREMWDSPSTATHFPKCVHLFRDKIFDSQSPGFEKKLCREMSQDMQHGKDFCQEDMRPFLKKPLPQDRLENICHAAENMYTKGDASGCNLIPGKFCPDEALVAKAFIAKNANLCPTNPIDRAICRALVSKKPETACSPLWGQLLSDYCAVEASVGVQNLPKKAGPNPTKRQSRTGGPNNGQ